ncbi:uncharacterized protein VP01_3819g1 [Puccinia sorghi]|uniref:Uncharacterized protein n=1 Tax=Puccinia sorghi TaxID=27349 RepID=A0A0L6UU38_9BASI|nr:uncharacterized protein VP01_3819g1 [Puccinia sorghi]
MELSPALHLCTSPTFALLVTFLKLKLNPFDNVEALSCFELVIFDTNLGYLYLQLQISHFKAAQEIIDTIVVDKEKKCLSTYLELIIDKKAREIRISKKLKAIKLLNVHKRKATLLEKASRKQRKFTLGKYLVIRGKMINRPAFLVCFHRRGGHTRLMHTHKFCTVV